MKIIAKISEKYNKYALINYVRKDTGGNKWGNSIRYKSDVVIEDIDIKRFSLTSHVNKNIPKNDKVNNRFALIIGNEDYKSFQRTLTLSKI